MVLKCQSRPRCTLGE
ncbi:hypothetical protein MTR67_042710 [Solanum verrucosum]|uniref:Uncharacterized protein n=1 Tax=Solanum verrucosum TaxID=315347 RepID=A0AAF0ZTY9_SOLVR|nr:hypothetical protein MTR67_042710 [Solanum verrucosum]